jgi:hypothetical protein
MSKGGNTIVIAASLIATVRLARVDNLSRTPKVVATISDSIRLAKEIYESAERIYPELFREP